VTGSGVVDYDVVVVGAGPSGLLLAAELTRHGVSTALLERRLGRDGAGLRSHAGTRAVGVHGRTLAVMEPSGATERLLAGAARITRGVARSGVRQLGEVRLDRTHTRFPFVATAPQSATEAAVGFGGPEPMRGAEVRAVTELAHGVVVAVRIGSVEVELHARAAVIAAGASGRELLRPWARAHTRAYSDRYVMTDLYTGGGPGGEYPVDAADAQPPDTAILTLHPEGIVESFPLPGGRRLVAWQGGDWNPAPGLVSNAGENAELLRRAVAERAGEPELAERIGSATSFRIRRVLLSRMRRGRVLAIGDTAHEISPIGGQGMNLGLIDAATLSPVLARWVRGSGGEDASVIDELQLWETDRLAAARTAARIAELNTRLGRGRPAAVHGAATALVRAALATPLRGVAARAYTMGFDRSGSSVF